MRGNVRVSLNEVKNKGSASGPDVLNECGGGGITACGVQRCSQPAVIRLTFTDNSLKGRWLGLSDWKTNGTQLEHDYLQDKEAS